MSEATVNTGGDEAPADNEAPGTQRRNHSIAIFTLLSLLLLNRRAASNRGREEEDWRRWRRRRMGWISWDADREGGMNGVDVRGEACH